MEIENPRLEGVALGRSEVDLEVSVDVSPALGLVFVIETHGRGFFWRERGAPDEVRTVRTPRPLALRRPEVFAAAGAARLPLNYPDAITEWALPRWSAHRTLPTGTLTLER